MLNQKQNKKQQQEWKKWNGLLMQSCRKFSSTCVKLFLKFRRRRTRRRRRRERMRRSTCWWPLDSTPVKVLGLFLFFVLKFIPSWLSRLLNQTKIKQKSLLLDWAVVWIYVFFGATPWSWLSSASKQEKKRMAGYDDWKLCRFASVQHRRIATKNKIQ